MATKLFFSRQTDSGYSTGSKDANLRGTAVNWLNLALTTTQGTSAITRTVTSVAGPIAGIEPELSSNVPVVWYSAPLDADVTIAGSITWNLRAAEAAMTNNAAINGQLEVIDGATGTITLIDKTARTVECGTAESANNFAETPASGVACKRGDRLRVRVFFDDSVDGNMAAGGILSFYHGGAAGATGDSYFTLTEDLTFVSEPAGSTIYPTDTASAVSTASVDREAWTSRGAGVQTDVANTTTGPTAPIQMTDTAGGTVVDWFTRQLAAFTLGGAVRVNARGLTSNVASDATWRCEIARVASDGTSPSVWGATTHSIQTAASETAHSFLVSGDDLAISDGQRLRVRFYIDDFIGSGGGQMVTGHTLTLYYAGTSGGASGDTYLTFTQTLTEFVAGTTVTPTTAALATATFAPTVTAPNPQLVTPATASLTATAFAPTVTLAETVTPTTAALTLATLAPTVTVTAHVTVTPTAAALTLATLAPTVSATAHQTLTPTTAALTTTAFAPTVTAAAGVSVTPTTASLITTAFAPSVTASDIKLVTPTTVALTTAANAPTVTATNHQAVTPTTKAAVLATFAPTVSTPRLATATTASLATTAFAPTVSATAHQVAAPTTKALTTAAFAPTVTSTAHQTVTPIAASLTTAFQAPSVTSGDAREVVPDRATLTLTTFAPTVTGAANVTVTPTPAALVTATFAPIVSAFQGLTVTPTTAALTTATFAPTVTATTHVTVTPTTASLATALFAPSVYAPQTFTPTVASLVLTTFAPSVGTGPALISGGVPPGASAIAPIPDASGSYWLPAGTVAPHTPTATASSLNPE